MFVLYNRLCFTFLGICCCCVCWMQVVHMLHKNLHLCADFIRNCMYTYIYKLDVQFGTRYCKSECLLLVMVIIIFTFGQLTYTPPPFCVSLQGYLETGAIFDSSVQAQRDPLVFMLGQRKVIPGKQFLPLLCLSPAEVRCLNPPPPPPPAHTHTNTFWSSVCCQ